MRRTEIEIAFPFTPICGARQTCSNKVEFNFMNGNLIAPQVDRLSLLMTQPGGTRVWLFDSGQSRETTYPDDGRPLKRELVNELNE
jgi:hypothetical protein